MICVDVIPLEAVDRQLRDKWNSLLDESEGDLSLSYPWYRATAKSRAAEGSARVLLGREAGRLVGIIPGIERRISYLGVSLKMFEAVGNYLVAYHPSLLTVGNHEQVLREMLVACRGRYEAVVLPNVEIGGRTFDAIRSVATGGVGALRWLAGHMSPYLLIESDWDAYLKTKDKKFRYQVRNGLKGLSEAGVAREVWYDTVESIRELERHILRIESGSWKSSAGTAISSSTMEAEFYSELLPHLATIGALRACVLFCDDEPVAYSLCYVSRGSHRQLKTSYLTKYERHAAGAAAIQASVKRAFEESAVEFDFLGDMMPHKAKWSRALREHMTAYLFLPGLRAAWARGVMDVKGWARGVIGKARK